MQTLRRAVSIISNTVKCNALEELLVHLQQPRCLVLARGCRARMARAYLFGCGCGCGGRGLGGRGDSVGIHRWRRVGFWRRYWFWRRGRRTLSFCLFLCSLCRVVSRGLSAVPLSVVSRRRRQWRRMPTRVVRFCIFIFLPQRVLRTLLGRGREARAPLGGAGLLWLLVVVGLGGGRLRARAARMLILGQREVLAVARGQGRGAWVVIAIEMDHNAFRDGSLCRRCQLNANGKSQLRAGRAGACCAE